MSTNKKKYCKNINVKINSDGTITVNDDGRGIPVGMHKKEGVSALEVVMTKIGAGGKFDKDSYKVSGGLHGVGVSCVNALSESLTAKVFREGKEYEQNYTKGKPNGPVKEIGKSDKRGTLVTFTPDKEIFKEITDFDYEILSKRMRELSFLNKGITISILDNRKKDKDGNPLSESFHSKEGLSEFIKYLDESREPIINNIIKNQFLSYCDKNLYFKNT